MYERLQQDIHTYSTHKTLNSLQLNSSPLIGHDACMHGSHPHLTYSVCSAYLAAAGPSMQFTPKAETAAGNMAATRTTVIRTVSSSSDKGPQCPSGCRGLHVYVVITCKNGAHSSTASRMVCMLYKGHIYLSVIMNHCH